MKNQFKDDGNIMSDDPKAIEKLGLRLETLEARRTDLREFNKLARKEGKDKALKRYPILQHYFRGHRGEILPSFVLTAASGKIREAKKRIESLKIMAEQRPIDFWVQDQDAMSVEVNEQGGRVCVWFHGKPDKVTRHKLKTYPLSMRWAPSIGAWVRKKTATMPVDFLAVLRETLEASESES